MIGEFNLKRLMIAVLTIPAMVYIGLAIAAYFYADNLIFQPQPSFYHDDSSIIKLTTEKGERISAKYFQNPNAEYTILFSHGNAEDIGTATSFLKELSRDRFSVFAYDYRGYGTSEGKPSEKNSYRDIDAAYDYLTGELKISPEKIIVHGRSLGGAVSIDLASRKTCGGLIIESSFVSAFRVLTNYKIFPFDKFSSLSKINRVKCPILFIHGKKDNIIAFWHGEMLFAAANEPKHSFWIYNAGHNNVFAVAKDGYLQTIKEFSVKINE